MLDYICLLSGCSPVSCRKVPGDYIFLRVEFASKCTNHFSSLLSAYWPSVFSARRVNANTRRRRPLVPPLNKMVPTVFGVSAELYVAKLRNKV